MSPENVEGGRFGATAEAVVKLLGALTGLAAIAYALGALVLARRLQAADLPWRETVAALPRDQVLATGTVELAYSLLGALMILATAAALVGLSWRTAPDGTAKRLLKGLVLFSVVSLVAVPFNWVGLLCLSLLLALTFWLYVVVKGWVTRDELDSLLADLRGASEQTGWSRRPLGWIALLLTAIVVVLTIGRIWSFPENYDIATATVDEAPSVREAFYVGSGSEFVILGVPHEHSGHVILLRRDSVTRLELRANPEKADFSRSLISRLGLIPVTCFYPTYRTDP